MVVLLMVGDDDGRVIKGVAVMSINERSREDRKSGTANEGLRKR